MKLYDKCHSVTVLFQLSKAWQYLLQLNILCYKFPNSDMFLSILATDFIKNMPNSLEQISEYDLQQWQHSNVQKDIEVLCEFWNTEFDADMIEKSIQLMENNDFHLSANQKWDLQHRIHDISHGKEDPIIKGLMLYVVLYHYIKNLDNKHGILRILHLLFTHHLGYLEHPVLFPIFFIVNFTELMTIENVSTIEEIEEKHIVFFLKQFISLCSLGISVLYIFHHQIHEALEKINQDTSLGKLFISDKVLSVLCQQFILTIPYLMDKLHWKRDKAARFLAKLCKLDVCIELKRGKEKYFVNNIILQTFVRVQQNQKIRSIMSI